MYMYVIVYTIKQKVVKTETWDKEFPIVYTTIKIMLHYIIMKHLGAFYLWMYCASDECTPLMKTRHNKCDLLTSKIYNWIAI